MCALRLHLPVLSLAHRVYQVCVYRSWRSFVRLRFSVGICLPLDRWPFHYRNRFERDPLLKFGFGWCQWRKIWFPLLRHSEPYRILIRRWIDDSRSETVIHLLALDKKFSRIIIQVEKITDRSRALGGSFALGVAVTISGFNVPSIPNKLIRAYGEVDAATRSQGGSISVVRFISKCELGACEPIER